MTGWAQSAGEVFIYSRGTDLGRLYDKSCVSGFYADEHSTLPRALQNRRVRVYGHFITLDQFEEIYLARGAMIGIENYCGGDKLIVIDRIEPW